jgi:hypothetical protein
LSENVGGVNLFSSGGHRWSWGRRQPRAKLFSATGVSGEGRIVLGLPGTPAVIQGVLRGAGATRALADTALDALETAIKALVTSGQAKAFEDDEAHTGDSVVLETYDPHGPRLYGQTATAVVQAWQYYSVQVRDLTGTR